MATVASSTPREALPLSSSLGIAIPIFARPVKASGGSGEAGRGMGEETEVVGRREEPLHRQLEGADVPGMAS